MPEKQEIQEDTAKAYRKLLMKKEKRLSFPIKQLSKGDLDSSNKSENLLLNDESDTSMEKYTQPQVFTLDDITEEDVILTKLCGKKFFPLYCKSSDQE